MLALDRLSRVINRWIEFFLFGLGFAMALIVAVQVFSRYVLNHSLFWSEELARYMLVWLTFLGASVAYRRNVHPAIDIFYSMWAAKIKNLITIFIHLISITLFGIMIIYGCQFASFVRLQISPALYLPKWIVFGIIPLSGLVMLIHGLAFLLSELRGGCGDS